MILVRVGAVGVAGMLGFLFGCVMAYAFGYWGLVVALPIGIGTGMAVGRALR